MRGVVEMARQIRPARGLLMVSMAAALFPAAAFGQTGPDATEAQAGKKQENKQDPVTLDALNVTAERYGGKVATTPISVTALSYEALADRQVKDAQALVNQIPGIVLAPATAGSSQMKVVVRGAGTETGGIRSNGTVGVYIDNVIQPRPMGAFFDFFDVSRVEFLRGPQGTLYGRNTSGGAIKLVTKQPSYDWTGAVQLGVGDWNAREGKFYVSGPLIEDKLAFSLSGVHRERDGYIRGLQNDGQMGDIDRSAERLKLLFQPTEKMTFELSAYAMQDNSDATIPIPLVAPFGVNDPYAVPGRSLTFNEVQANLYQKILQRGGSLNATYDVSGNLQLASITGYGVLRQESLGNDVFLSPARIAANGGRLVVANTNTVRLESSWWTQEFNAIYMGERLKAVGGLYYFYEDGNQQGAAAGSQTDDARNVVKAPAIFGQATYALGNGFSVVAGLRYTRETTEYYALTLGAAAGAQVGQFTFVSTTPKLGLNWEVNSRLFTYLSWTRGTRSGGFNSRDPMTAELVPTPYGAEWVDSYELGTKITSADNKFRLNATAYVADYTDLQLSTIIPNTAFVATLNDGAARVSGIELEPSWQVTDSFNLYANMAFNTGKYTKDFQCANAHTVWVDCTHKKIKGLPAQKISIGFRFTPTISQLHGTLTLNGAWDHTSKVYNNIANEPELVQTAALDLFNASIAWRSNNGAWDVSLEGRNLTDKNYVSAGFLSSHPTQPAVVGYIADRRQLMLRVGYSF
jgi:iron complex outermembrane receptor protein